MSNVIEVLTHDELKNVLDNNDTVIVDYAAPSWCVPCQRLAPHYNAASEQVPEVKFVHVDIDRADTSWISTVGIQGVPTVVAFRKGRPVGPVMARTVLQLVREANELKAS